MKQRTSDPPRRELSESYRDTGFFVVRSPLLPFQELDRWGSGGTPEAAGEAALRRERCAGELRRHFERPELREALFLASPGLEQRVSVWLAGQAPDARLLHTLARYFARLSSRETPFGTFAGVALGRVGQHTELCLAGREHYRRRVRLDMDHLVRRLARHAAEPALRNQIQYEANSTLHLAFGRWRFAFSDPSAEPGVGASSPVVDVTRTEHLDAALARAAQPVTLSALAAQLDAPEPVRRETLGFVNALVEHGLLGPAWSPALTGPEPQLLASRALSEQAGLNSESERLEAACQLLSALDPVPIGAALPELRALASGLAQEASPRREQLFHAALVKPGRELSLGRDVVRQLLRAADLVQRVSAPQADPRLERFRERFLERHGSRFVALGEALDGDLGVGFESFQSPAQDVLIADLPLHGAARGSAGSPFTTYDQIRLGILTGALQRGERVVELDQELLAQFPSRRLEPLPESFAIVAQLARSTHGVQVVAPTLVAPSGITLVARFCHADAALAQAVRAHAEIEQRLAGERILVDVVHLPDGQAANILLRPVLRSHEFVYGGKSGAPPEACIPLSDVYLGLVGERIVLVSERLGRQLSIRVTNAHNVDGWWHLPVYRFLGALQEAERGALSARWSWGPLAQSLFLPRVVAENVVLCRARWNLTHSDLAAALETAPEAAFARMQELRQRLGLPRWLVQCDEPHPLTLDLDNPLSVEALLQQSHTLVRLSLEELLPAPDQLCLKGPEGTFTSEVVLPVARRVELTLPTSPERRQRMAILQWRASAARSRPPGSEWLYAKIYGGISALPRVLERLAPLLTAERLGPEGRWFFLPYADPEPHLRLRLRAQPRALCETLLPALQRELQPLLESGTLWRLQFDTYGRELERYGGPIGMELAEELFWVDSEAVLALAQHLRQDPMLRWQLAAVGMHRLLDDLGFSLAERGRLAANAVLALRREFALSVETERAIGAKYRTHAQRLSELLWCRAAPASTTIAHCLELLRIRSQRLSSVCARLAAALEAGQISATQRDLASSFVHLHVLRTLGSGGRAQELVLYDFLSRQYTSEQALAARPRVGIPG